MDTILEYIKQNAKEYETDGMFLFKADELIDFLEKFVDGKDKQIKKYQELLYEIENSGGEEWQQKNISKQ